MSQNQIGYRFISYHFRPDSSLRVALQWLTIPEVKKELPYAVLSNL